ncbi:carboxylesterase/lipase family protein [Zunongwangia sp. HRR-M8]|uniref:carboxylesterase/lipase family protein n=1 Tax=Zunongwangia sp. HRR-M8 TaxID=3015170 RepID=UPI0022DD8C0D|nr:carboxylesterase family protein [Zunongwangia sp. HRR-M8]WBL21352.1 carboxylesterase family protein [Zunongwangia sp. HRR-M8]
MKKLLFFTLIFCNLLVSAQNFTKIKVEGGFIKGYNENDLTIFKGIPFAAPPVDELRWKAPQPVKKWEGIKNTTNFSNSPFQPGNPVAGKSEDCLYLNVWTPAKSKNENLPVMVWIYGGGFSFGSSAEPVCDGSSLAKKGVIVISIAYRVGPLGFLAHPELSKETESNTSGNYGLLDQIAGLKWVQNNIKSFGGNPDNVTIFGESAGGISVSMLCASPLAKGLFKGAISQSGGSFGPTRKTTYPGENMKTLKQAEADGVEYLKKADVSSIEELRELPAEDLPMGMGMQSSWPIVDGYVIPDAQYELYKDGNFNDVPVLIGYNSDEGASFSREKTPQQYIENVQNRYGKFSDKLIEAYPVSENKVSKTARDLTRDAAFGWHTWKWANLQSQKGNTNVFYYYFDKHPEYPKDSPQYGYGSPHGQDIAYAFMNLEVVNKGDISASDKKLAELMGTYWTNFAKYGDPNSPSVPEWPSFSKNNPKVMYLDANPHLGPVPSENSLKVLDDYFEWRYTPEGKTWEENH